MSGFHNIQLNTENSYGVTRDTEYFTSMYVNDQGVEQRVLRARKPRVSFNLSKMDMGLEEVAELENFYNARRGMTYSFRFKDWSHYRAVDQVVLNPGTASLQLQYKFDDTVNPYTKSITKPVSGTVTLKKNGSAYGGGYSVNYTTGVVTLTGGPEVGTFTWSGEYDHHVRFNSALGIKHTDFQIFDAQGFELIEVYDA